MLNSSVTRARDQGGSSLMVTFDPHPVRVLRPGEAPRLLTNLPHKLKLAADLGVEKSLVVSFTPEFSQATGPQFVQSLLSGGTPIRSVSVGQDWRFGYDRSGDLKALRQIGAARGFAVNGVPPLHLDGKLVSSTLIRSLIEAGRLEEASAFLGRPFSLMGRVEYGQQLGRTLGFPTANVACDDLQLPPSGVYASRATLSGQTWPAVANLGFRPTVTGTEKVLRLEVHLLRYIGPEFYGENLEVAFVRRLRGEEKFESVSALTVQIARDAQRATEILACCA